MDANLLNRDESEDANPGPSAKKRRRGGGRYFARQGDQSRSPGWRAHGAFTWGVLDRLLEDQPIVIDGISATSAGAMNATVTAFGIGEGGRAGARQALTNFWRRVSQAGDLGKFI